MAKKPAARSPVAKKPAASCAAEYTNYLKRIYNRAYHAERLKLRSSSLTPEQIAIRARKCGTDTKEEAMTK